MRGNDYLKSYRGWLQRTSEPRLYSGQKWHFTGNRQITKGYVYEISFYSKLMVKINATIEKYARSQLQPV